VQPGRREALARDLDALFAQAGESSRPYSVSDELLVLSDSPAHVAWALAHLGQGAGSPFAAAIGQRYQRGAGWLVALDTAPMLSMASADDEPVELARMTGLKYLFLEQRTPGGAEENEVTATFGGTRSGIASWLADGGSGGAAEFLPAEALVAGYVSVRQPGQLFQEFTALMAGQGMPIQSELSQVEAELGNGFVANLTAAMGTEAAFALQGLSVTGPTWIAIGMVTDPSVIDASIRKLVDACNANVKPGGSSTGCTLEQEAANGLVWNTLRTADLPVGVSWSYYGGYLIAASDRGTGERAIAARNTGSALVWSTAFRTQLPASSALQPSAFAWLNARGALGLISSAAPNSAVASLLAARDPMLLVVDGKPDQIHLASRTRLSGVVIDAMLLGSLSNSMPR
jgi:hypothetical protein